MKEVTLNLTQEDLNQIMLGLDARTVDVQRRIKGDTTAWLGNIPALKSQIAKVWNDAPEA